MYEHGGVKVESKARPLGTRRGPSLVSFSESHIFIIGGELLTSVDCYNIRSNTWSEAPAVNKERADASSCEQGDFVYTFGGLKSKAGYQLADIERLNARHFIQGRSRKNTWELLQLTSSDGNILTRRENAIMTSVNDREILILGGDGESGFKSDAFLLDTH